MRRLGLLACVFVVGVAFAQDAEEEPKFEDDIHLDEVDPPADGSLVTVPFILHLWDLTETADGTTPRGRTITLHITPPRGIGAIDVRHAPWSDDGSAPDGEFKRGTEIAYGADETAREVRVSFKRTGAIAGDLVVVAKAADPKVLPRERRIVIPLKREEAAPEGEAGLYMSRRNDDGGYQWEPPSTSNAYPWTDWKPYLFVPWEKSDATVTGTVKGGFPPSEIDLESPNSRRRRGRGPPLYLEGTYLIDLGMGSTYAVGDFKISGELRAGDGSTKKFEETIRYYPHPDRHMHGKMTWLKRDGRMSGFVDLEFGQWGGRWATVSGGGATRYAFVEKNRILVSLPALSGPVSSISVSLVDFGKRVTLPVRFDELKRDERDPIAIDEGDLARATRNLDRARDAHARASALHALAKCYELRVPVDPTWLARKREAYDATERALREHPDSREIILRNLVSYLEGDIVRAIESGEAELARAWIRRADEVARETGRGPGKWVWSKYAHGMMELTGNLDEARALWRKGGSDRDFPRIPDPMFDE